MRQSLLDHKKHMYKRNLTQRERHRTLPGTASFVVYVLFVSYFCVLARRFG